MKNFDYFEAQEELRKKVGNKKMAKFDAELRTRRISDPGIGQFEWFGFLEQVSPLCCREKLRPTHWHRFMDGYFLNTMNYEGFPEDAELASRVTGEMMAGSRSWCNPQIGIEEAGGRAALRKAFDTILAAQVSTGADVESVDSDPLSSPVAQ